LIYFFSSEGKCLRATSEKSVTPEIIDRFSSGCGASSHVETETQYPPEKIFLRNGKIEVIPDKPREGYYFDYAVKQWMPDSATKWLLVRSQRDAFLAASDWTQLPDVNPALREKWIPYRQDLRDVTKEADPFKIVWPEAPQ
jgi:hypothetical protein